MLGLLLPVVVLLAFAPAARPARAAAPLPAEVLPPLMPPSLTRLIDGQAIQKRQQEMLTGIISDSTLGRGAWACVVVGQLVDKPRVVVSFQVQENPRPGNAGVYTVTVTLTLVGQGKPATSAPYVVRPRGGQRRRH